MHRQSNASLLYSPTTSTATNTLKDQIEQLESSLHHHQKVMQAQKKSHNELYLQIKNLEHRAQQSYTETIQKIDESVDKTLLAMNNLQKHSRTEYESLQIQKHELEDGQRMVANRTKEISAQCENLILKVGL